jgi:hypothetical protein
MVHHEDDRALARHALQARRLDAPEEDAERKI